MRVILILLAALFSTHSRASDTALYVEAGSSFSNMMKTTSSDDASKSLLGTHQFIFSLSGKVWGFRPEVAYTILPRKGPDDTYKSRLMVIQIPYLFDMTDSIALKAGASLWMHKVSGDGGTVLLSNGTGTSTFYKPERSSSANTLAFTAGATFMIFDGLGLDFDLNLLSPLSKRRSISAIAQLTWSLYEN